MAATYEPIASHTLTGSTASYTFSAIPGTFTDLIVVCDYSTTGTNSLYYQFGATSVDAGSNYSQTNLTGNGSSASSSRRTNNTGLLIANASSRGTGNRNITILQFMSYANTNVYKTVLEASAAPSLDVYRTVGLWRSTAAIDIISIQATAAIYTSGSTFSLFGIKEA